jgi:cytochrome P450 / NADPH-cytochrome P450 reductase
MTDFLKECFARSSRPTVVQALMTGATAKYAEDMKFMTDLANKSSLSNTDDICVVLKLCIVLAERKAHPTDKKDLLGNMLSGRDPKTGQGLSDDSVTKNASFMLFLYDSRCLIF